MLKDRGAVLTGLGIGAGLMYFLDVERGRRRRALVRDRVAHAANVGADAMGAAGRDLANRAKGAAARVRRPLRDEGVDDAVLVERVRAQLGRYVSHPHAVQVEAVDGVVTLRGPILQSEVKSLLRAIGRVRGVREIDDALETHKRPDGVPALQGGGTPPAYAAVSQRRWSPATRVLVAGTGAALTGYGGSRGDGPGAVVAAAGIGLLAAAATNLGARRLTGIGAGRRAVDVQKTIMIDAPPEDVFRFWTNYENFPRFMSRVLNVQQSTREGQSRWTVEGPAGVPVEFDAEVTALVPNEAVGWRTIEGSAVAHAGLVRFEPAGDGRTRVHIRMSYNPPGGWLGHGIAAAFGVDPKSSMDADLARMKTLLETGRPARDAAQPVGTGR